MLEKLKKIKPLYVLLGVSLALNAFIIGAGVHYGGKLRHMGKDSQWIEKRLDRTEKRIIRHFEGEDRALAEKVFSAQRLLLTDAFADIRNARRDFRDAMAADTPDPAQLTAALDASQDAAARVNTAFHGTLRELSQGLSPEARRKVAEHMKRHRHHRHKKGDKYQRGERD